MSINRIFFLLKILSALGILLAIYLLWEQITQSSFQPCSINATVNCDAIISGAVAKTLGVPTPLYGLVGYFVIFISAMLKKKKLLLGMASFGLVFCMWIGYYELFLLHVVCPICVTCQLIMITVFVLAVIIIRKKV